MKKFFLITLLTTAGLQADWANTQSRQLMSRINSATTQSAFTAALSSLYATYGDPSTSKQGIQFLENAFAEWEKQRFSAPFFTYATFMQQQAAPAPSRQPCPPCPEPTACSACPEPEPCPKPVACPQPTPTRRPSMKMLAPEEFAAQLVDQVIKTIALLENSIKDPMLVQSITQEQRQILVTAIDTLSTLLETKQ